MGRGVVRLVHRYGPSDDQFFVLRIPPGDRPRPVMALVHGGFWRERYSAALHEPVAEALALRGWATCNVEYRRMRASGRHDWRETCDDVRLALESLGERANEGLDLACVVCAGHSAGAQLALWSSAVLGPDRIRLAVSLAGVVDLTRASQLGLGSGAVDDFLGGPPRLLPDRYRSASPAARLPLGVPQLLVHGVLDDTVPVALSRAYARAAVAAGDELRLVELAGVGHYEFLDPSSPAWAAVLAEVAAALVGRTPVEAADS